MIKVLVAGVIGTVLGVVVMIILMVVSGSTTEGATSVGLGSLPLSTASLSSGGTSTPVSTPTSTPPPSSSGGGTSTGAAGNPDNGKTIFTGSAGCGGCHTLAAAGTTAAVGPPLDDLSKSAQAAGEQLDAFIKSSIVDPGAYVAPGFPDGVMPTNFGSTLSASDIDDLVAFISASQK
jgi:cytochrome c551/c552